MRLPDPALVVLVGASGAGKSTWARARYRGPEIVSSDDLRGVVGSGPNDLDASADAFGVLDHKIGLLRAHCADVGRDPAEVAVTVLDLPVIGRNRDDVWARVERHRGRMAAAAYAARTHAGTVADQRDRHALLAGRGVTTVFLATPDLAGADDVLALAGLNS